VDGDGGAPAGANRGRARAATALCDLRARRCRSPPPTSVRETSRRREIGTRCSPRDDLLSALLAVEEDRERLSESELLSLAATLYSAGHRTTRDLFSNGLSVLLRDRTLMQAMQRGDVTIPPGEPITLLLASANRDPAAYPDGDCFEPRRWLVDPPPPAPLSFAFGPHYCLGASLAKLEAETMLETLLASRPEIALADEALAWRHTGLFRGLRALPVRLGRPAARPRTLS